jgi:hypothetical protein
MDKPRDPRPSGDPRTKELVRRRLRRRRDGPSGLEPAPVEPRDGGGLSGGAAAPMEFTDDR